MGERSLKQYDYYQDAVQRYDYFLTGLIGAVFTYNLQNLSPEKFNFSPYSLQIISLICFLAGFLLSIFRLKRMERIYFLNFINLHNSEMKGKLTNDISKPFVLNLETGDILSNEQIQQQINEITKTSPNIIKEMDKERAKTKKYYKIREYLLILGFVLLVIAKIWNSY